MSFSVQTEPVLVNTQQLLSPKQIAKPGPLHVCQAPKAHLFCSIVEVSRGEALLEQS